MNNREYREHRIGRLRVFGAVVAVAVAVTLTMVVGSRLSNEALSVIAGAVCGVGVAIPTSLIILSVARRRDEARVMPVAPDRRRDNAYPQIVVISPPPAQQPAGGWNPLPASMAAAPSRRFTVVGGASIGQDAWVEEPTY